MPRTGFRIQSRVSVADGIADRLDEVQKRIDEAMLALGQCQKAIGRHEQVLEDARHEEAWIQAFLKHLNEERQRLSSEVRSMESRPSRRSATVDELVQRAIDLIDQAGGDMVTTARIADALGGIGVHYASLVLGKAVKKGRIKRLKNGVYQAVPPDDGDHGKVVSLRGR